MQTSPQQIFIESILHTKHCAGSLFRDGGVIPALEEFMYEKNHVNNVLRAVVEDSNRYSGCEMWEGFVEYGALAVDPEGQRAWALGARVDTRSSEEDSHSTEGRRPKGTQWEPQEVPGRLGQRL